jgi:hypothetical protein
VFREKGCGDHAVPIMHVGCFVEAAHGSVDDGVASASCFPGLELHGVVFPFDVSVFEFEGLVHADVN